MAATVTVVCPQCKNRMRASAEHIGRKGRCPACKNLVEIRPSVEESVRTLAPVTGPGGRPTRPAGGTDVSPWLAGVIGTSATILLYVAIFLPLRGTYVGNLFLERGFIPFVTVLVTFWGHAILALKLLAVKRQFGYAERELELIPLEIGVQITTANVDQFLDHLSSLPRDEQQSILARRIQGALEHFKHRNSVPEVQEYLTSQAEIEASGVDSGYTLLRAFIWTVPILGFIGTVMGISDAVTVLAKAVAPATAPAEPGAPAAGEANAAGAAPADDISKRLMEGMGGVIKGLATAFDTTFIALVMAILLLFPTEALRKREYAMLDRTEAFTNESLLRRLVEKRAVGQEELPEIVRDTLEAAFQEHQRWLAQWQAQVSKLGEVIGGDFEAAARNLEERLTAGLRERFGELLSAQQSMEDLVRTTGNQFSQLHASGQAVVQGLQAAVAAAEQMQLGTGGAAGFPPTVASDAGQVVPALVRLEQCIGQLEQQIGRLADRIVGDGAATLEPVVAESQSGLLSRWLGRKRG
jgi:biopolymer transport protein ExbB/TolQ